MYEKHMNNIYKTIGRGTGLEIVYPELFLDSDLSVGSKGKKVLLAQEWLWLNGFKTARDGQFGPATAATVRAFQEKAKIGQTGCIEKDTWAALVKPMMSALKGFYIQSRSFAQLVHDVAFWRHSKVNPQEIENNLGPWVRLYMGPGGEGNPWCAGFVTFVMAQVSFVTKLKSPIEGSWSCDVLAGQAKHVDLFKAGTAVAKRPDIIKPGDIFLVRKTPTDFTHTGLVHEVFSDHITTIEGNTNDEGSREGYELCLRRRGFKSLDFIILA